MIFLKIDGENSRMVLSLNYKELDLQISKESPNLYRASIMNNGSMSASHIFPLRINELKVLENLRRMEEQATSAPKKETFHEDFGIELYNKVFAGELGGYFKKCFEDAGNCAEGLRLSLRFTDNASDIAALPWEFLHDGSEFLAISRKMLISRLPEGLKKAKYSPLDSILRMLVVISSPIDPEIPQLNTEHEQEVILEAVDKLQREHKMEIDFTEDATFETIEGYLNEKEYHIVHFTGHGAYSNGRGYLILETSDGKARKVDNSTVSNLLADRGVRLVTLSACQSGKLSNKEAYSDLASALVKENIPAVVAMQYSIFDDSATKFASAFYHALANGKPIDLSLTEARIVMKNYDKSNGIDFATPILYLHDPQCVAVGSIKPEPTELSTKPVLLSDVQLMKKGFVGRRKELRLLQKGFSSDIKRAAIIYGFGGIGKTVLATRLVLKMNKYFDGVFGVKCKASTRPEDILNELNGFLLMGGIQQFNQILSQQVSLKVKTASLVNILNQRRFLIIFDNFEDCLDETGKNIASPELREFIQHLLNSTISNTKYIFTTRYNFDPLDGRLTGAIEHIHLPEMPFPQTMWLMNNFNVLADLSSSKKHDIYRAIGGHPWTVQLFAKHAAAEGVDSLLLELAPLKREVIEFTLLDRSYSKLDEKAKALLLRASIYQEAVPVEALSWIIGDEKQPSPHVGEALLKLMDWGLMAKEEEGEQALYALHTLVRDFARQEMEKEELDRKSLLIRAAQYYEMLVETTKSLWDHLKAREYYYQAQEWEKADDIVIGTYEYLMRWGYIELVMNLLNQSIKTTSDYRRAVASGNLANIYQGLGDWKTAIKMHTEVKEIFEKEGQKKDVAAALHQLGIIHYQQGNYEEAVKLYNQSLQIKNELGDKKGRANTLGQLGMIHYQQGNYEEAVKLYNQSLQIFEELGDKSGRANTLHHLGIIHHDQGNYEGAMKLYNQSLQIFEELGYRKGRATVLHQLGMIHYQQGNYEEAVKLYNQSLQIFEELGDKSGRANTLHQLGMIHYQQGNYEEAVKLYNQSLQIKNELGDKKGRATTLGQLGRIHEVLKDFPAALEKYLTAFIIFKELNSPNSKTAEEDISRMKKEMGEPAFNKALEEFGRRHDS